MFKNCSYIFLICICLHLLGATACRSRKEGAAAGEKLQLVSSEIERKLAEKFIDGCAARIKGNLEVASKLFVECHQLDPSNTAVKYELAMVYKIMGVNDQALHYARAAAQAEPMNEWYQMLLIEIYNSMRLYKESVKVMEGLVKNFPNKNEFKEELAIQYSIIGQFDKAFKIYEELEKIYGINEQLSINKSKLLKSQKKFREAEAELIRLKESNPRETRYYSYLADFYIEQNDLERAKQMYDHIVAIEPNNPVVNLALHDYYSAQGKTVEAFEHLKKAFLNPDLDAGTKAGIVNTFYENVRKSDGAFYMENGIILARILVQVHPAAPEANAAYADFLMLDRKLQEASLYYHKAAMKDRGNYRLWKDMLSAYYKLSRWDSLERLGAIAMEYFPSSPDVYFYNGYANLQLRNYDKAARALKDGLEFIVDNRMMMVTFYKHLGDAYHYTKEYEKSDKAFEDVLKINSDDVEALNQYAYYLALRRENLDKAEKLARKCNELQPDNSHFMDTYGWILFLQKKYKEAMPWLSGAAKLGPRNPNILEHYGDLLLKLDQPEEAQKLWEQAKDAGGNAERLNKKIKEKKAGE